MRFNFDRSKPFYPLVMTYLIQLHALKEIGLIGALAAAGFTRDFTIPSELANAKTEIESGIKNLLKPLNLDMTGETETFNVTIEFVAKEMAIHHSYLFGFQVRAASFCLAMAHEMTKDKPYRNNGEKWEFLRHCRHAISHNGKLHFKSGEPKKTAEWRGIRLKTSMHGEPLFVQSDGTGHLKLGDPIALLWDIENENPNISV